jgi:hypothetical protein
MNWEAPAKTNDSRANFDVPKQSQDLRDWKSLSRVETQQTHIDSNKTLLAVMVAHELLMTDRLRKQQGVKNRRSDKEIDIIRDKLTEENESGRVGSKPVSDWIADTANMQAGCHVIIYGEEGSFNAQFSSCETVTIITLFVGKM